MDGLRVPTKAEAKFRHEEFLLSLKEHKRKPRGKRKPRQSRKNIGDGNVFDTSNKDDISISCSKEADISKEGQSNNLSKIESSNLQITTPIRHGGEGIENEDNLATDLHKTVTFDTDKLYDIEKFGSELQLALQSDRMKLSDLSNDISQKVVYDFCLKWKLDVEKVNAVLKNYMENKQRMYDGMMAQLLKAHGSLNERKSVEMQQDLEVTKDTEMDKNTEHIIVVEEESDSFVEDTAIPIVRPRSPVILFEDDLSLENIIDEGTLTRKQGQSRPDLFKQDKDGDTFLHVAVVREHQSLPLLVEVMKKDTLDIQNRLGHTPLHLAVIVGNNEIVQSLVFHGSSVAVVDCNGNTPLHISCQNGDFVLTSSLVHRTVSQRSCGLETALATRNYEGETPLHIALSQALRTGDDATVRLLLGVDCDVNITHGRSGKTILFMALESKQYKLAEFLLEYGADPNIATFSGVCPLHLAAQSGRVALVRTLIQKNAFIYAKTSDSETAKDFASNDEIIQILENAMKKERRNRQKVRSGRCRKS